MSNNPKCSNCKCYYIQDEFKSSGKPFLTCKKCRDKDKQNKCEHNKRKNYCKQCGGSCICEHGKVKYECKLCDGNSICEHDKRRSYCKQCGGGGICQHDKFKSSCTLCGGGSICEHGKMRCKCKICNFKLCLVNIQRQNINRCFKISNLSKHKHSIEYLGCTIEELIYMFEQKMKYFNNYLSSGEIMTWDNIHIDHIKPVSVFDLDDEDEFLDCCHYSNLQPLLVSDNLEKNNKWSNTNEKYWIKNIKGKEYNEIYLIKNRF